MPVIKLCLPVLLILVWIASNGQKYENDATGLQSEKDTATISDEIEEVTVTAFRTPYNLYNTPAPINLITPLQLETGSSFTPVEALNQVPGILMHHATFNTNRLTIRGIGSRTPYATNKIKAYFGEIPLTSGDGETTLEDLENQSIKRVEILKGPSSSLYGAGLGGVILFHPKNVTKNHIRNKTTVASFGTVKNTLSAGVIEGKLNIFGLGSVIESNGFRDNNNTSRTNILLNSLYSISEKSDLQLLLKGTKMKAFIPSSLDKSTFISSPEKAASNWENIKGYEDYMTGQFGLAINYYPKLIDKFSIATFGSFREADELRPFNKLEESSKFIGWRSYIQKAIVADKTEITFTSGLEFFRERYNWSKISNENRGELLSVNLEKRSYENLFVQMETSINQRMFVSLGINGNLTRFDYKDELPEDGDQSGKHFYEPVISPRIGLNFHLQKSVFIFGNLSHGFSTPSFEETLIPEETSLPEGMINPDIKPETGWNVEAGLRVLVLDRLQATASYYRMYIKNLLVARRTGEDTYFGVNAGKSLHPGFEAELKLNVLQPGTYPALVISGNTTIANYHFQEFVDNNSDYSGNLLPGTARKTWLLAGNFSPISNAGIRAWYRFTGEMPVNDMNSDFTDSYGTANIEAEYSVNIKKFRFELKYGIQNIFDVKYAAMIAVNAPAFGGNLPRYYYPGNPRNQYVSLMIGFE